MRLGKDVLEADLYGELGLLPDATESEIRLAYRRRVRASHPDLNQHDPEAASRMSRLNVAAKVLLDPALRRAYDRVPRGVQEATSRAAPTPSAAWYEQRQRTTDSDWADAPATEPAPMSERERRSFGSFFSELRSRDEQLGLRLQERVAALTTREQIGMAVLFCALALMLIAWAHPQGLVGNELQPTSISVRAVNP
jgi:DnaJ-class molecular chaperone